MEKKKEEVKKETKEKKDFWGDLGDFVKKAVDCCIE